MVDQLHKAQMQLEDLKRWCQKHKNCKDVLRCALRTYAIRGIEVNTSPAASGVFASQLKWGKKVTRSHHFSMEAKTLALTTYKRGPKAYKILQSMIPIPSPRTLISFLNRTPFLPGINKLQFAHLREKVSEMYESDRVCSLLFDEVSLSPSLQYSESLDCILGFEDFGDMERENGIASSALIFMVNGLCKKWKQPVAYYFFNDATKVERFESLIVQLIESLQDIGLHILCTVGNQSATIRAALQNLVASRPTLTDLGTNGMTFNVNNEDITVIFDPLHLIKSLRNAFMEYNVVWSPTAEDNLPNETQTGNIVPPERAEASWDYVKLFAEKQKPCKYQLARKLTHAHIEPNEEQKKLVKLAVEVMSHSVLIGVFMMAMYPISFGLLHPRLPNTSASAMCTAHFVNDVNQLLDSFRGEKVTGIRSKKHRVALRARSIHFTYWPKMSKRIDSWEFTDKTTRKIHRFSFQDDWLTSIAGATHIGSVLRKKYYERSLRVRSLNHDVMINLICVIQQYIKSRTKPSCYQFISAFKTSIVNNLLRVNGWKSNTKALHDLHEVLLSDLNVFLLPDEAEPTPAEETIDVCLAPEDQPFQSFGPEDISDEFENENTKFNPEGSDLVGSLSSGAFTLDESECGIVAYVSSYVIQKVADSSCERCKSLVSVPYCQDKSYHTGTECRDQGQRSSPKYVAEQLVASLGLAAQVVNKHLQTAPHIINLKKQIEHQISSQVDFRWFDCEVHRETFLPRTISLVCRAMIHLFCKKMNHSLGVRE